MAKLGYLAHLEEQAPVEKKMEVGEGLENYNPLKCKMLLYLSLENKILTWDNCLKRGWIEPSICYLYKDESESVSHIFLSCSYTGHVWTLIEVKLKTSAIWCSKSLEESF